ncbi:hypothetical protein SCALM49S_02083 [Streptomyces californicus]
MADARGAEVAHLAAVRVPAIVERLHTGRRLDGVPGPLAPPERTGAEFARALDSVVVTLGSDAALHRERALRDSVQTAFESVARTMHVMATVQQQVLDEVERAIEDPLLMANVMKADHAASQMTRKAQTLLVMCGIWPTRPYVITRGRTESEGEPLSWESLVMTADAAFPAALQPEHLAILSSARDSSRSRRWPPIWASPRPSSRCCSPTSSAGG